MQLTNRQVGAAAKAKTNRYDLRINSDRLTYKVRVFQSSGDEYAALMQGQIFSEFCEKIGADFHVISDAFTPAFAGPLTVDDVELTNDDLLKFGFAVLQ